MRIQKNFALLALLFLCLLLAGCTAADDASDQADIPRGTVAPAPEGSVKVSLGSATLSFHPGTDFIYLTQDTHASVFNVMGMDGNSVLKSMAESGIYALLFDDAGTMEIHISAVPVSHENYDDTTGYAEARLVSDVKSDFITNGYDVWSCRLFRQNGHKFVRTLVSKTYADGAQSYLIDYSTCQAGWLVYMGVRPYADGPISEEKQSLTDTLADSIRIY